MSDSLVSAPLPALESVDVMALVADAVICADEEGRILLFNQAAERAFGYAAIEIIGQPIEILLPERNRAEHARQVFSFAQGNGPASGFMGKRREVKGRRKDGEEFPAEAMVSRHRIAGRTVLTVVHRDITERKAIEERNDAIARELDHRTRNVLSVVKALVSLSAQCAADVGEFKESLLGRVNALAATQAVLGFGAQQSTRFDALLWAELEQFRTADGTNIVVDGPAMLVGARAAQTLALVFHELATNSSKYGALSATSGHVSITTAFSADGSHYEIVWRETGGPPVTPPTRQGFGTTFIQQITKATFRTDVILEYPREGAVCRMILPRAKVEAAPRAND